MGDRWEWYLDRLRAMEAEERRARQLPLLVCPRCAHRLANLLGSPEPAPASEGGSDQ